MQSRTKEQIEFLDFQVLGNAESRLIEAGAPSSGITVINVTGMQFLTWSIRTANAATFSVEGALLVGGGAPAPFFTLYTVGVLAGVISTPYNLAAPMNGTGFVVLTRPFIRLRLLDTSAGAHAYTNVYAKAWG